MRKLLEKLYSGQLNPLEQIVSKDPAHHTLNRQITEAMGMWLGRLGQGDYEELEQLLDLRAKLEEFDMFASFEHGFQLGVSMIVESMAKWISLQEGKDIY
ncbi:DUF6809 family protein [Cohnella sp. GCM10020058]|uniref:DUF6809 family protein n=1 Tax=Cohnella sp. GCM10020058 TaxID=3317330 RepID=UPI00363D2E49